MWSFLGFYAAQYGSFLPMFWGKPFGPIIKSQPWPLKMWPIRSPETSVTHYHSTLRNNPEERRSNIHRGGSLKSRRLMIFGGENNLLSFSSRRGRNWVFKYYRGADKSLARPDWKKKNNWKVAIFRPTRWSLLPRRDGQPSELFLSGLQKL